MLVHHRSKVRIPFSTRILRNLGGGFFNAAILPRGENRYLIAARTPWDDVHTGYIDRDYKVLTKLRNVGLHKNIDPRLTVWRDQVWMTTRFYGDWDYWRLELWPLTDDGQIDQPTFQKYGHFCFMDVQDWVGYTRRRESNWTPFVEGGEFYYIHTFCPHRVLRLNPERRTVHLVKETPFTPIDWRIEDTQGYRLNAAPVLLPDGTYLGVIHLKMEERWSYFSGFYRFTQGPEWKVVAMSQVPVIRPEHAIGDAPPSQPACVFPMSLQIEGDLLRVMAGSRDVNTLALHFSLKEVLGHMKPVRY